MNIFQSLRVFGKFLKAKFTLHLILQLILGGLMTIFKHSFNCIRFQRGYGLSINKESVLQRITSSTYHLGRALLLVDGLFGAQKHFSDTWRLNSQRWVTTDSCTVDSKSLGRSSFKVVIFEFLRPF